MEPKKPDTAAEREAAKTSVQLADDWSYTIDHSAACLVSDFVTNPIFGGLTQKWLGKRYTIGGCGHDHSHNHDHHHDHHDHGHDHVHQHSHGVFGHTVLGEIIGDSVAVPVTIAFQRFAPGLMNGIRQTMEPLLASLFHNGARRSARFWAKENGVAYDSEACKEKEAQIYEREMGHLPQALMWTASSMTINIASQKLSGNKNPLWQIAAGCVGGISATAGLVVGSRALVPETVHKWDRFTGENIVLPITKTVKKIFGIKEKEEENASEGWTKRVTDSTPPITQPSL